MAVTGTNFVRFTRHGLQTARSIWKSTGDRFEIRRQALKLRFWDDRHQHPPGMMFDLSYESIKGLSGSGIYEARIDDEIGGQANIRIVFFDPPREWVPSDAKPLRVIWILEVFPKRRNEWTKHDLKRFKASRLILAQRCYGRTN